MSEDLYLYKCNICGNIIEVAVDGGGQLVCCGEEMEKLKAQHQDIYAEKHVPSVHFEGDLHQQMVFITIGEVEHPMTEEHHIQFIEAYSKDGVYIKRKRLKPHEKPELHFQCSSSDMIVRAYCNIHGLWEKIL